MKWVAFTLFFSLNLKVFHPLIDVVLQRVPQLKRSGFKGFERGTRLRMRRSCSQALTRRVSMLYLVLVT